MLHSIVCNVFNHRLQRRRHFFSKSTCDLLAFLTHISSIYDLSYLNGILLLCMFYGSHQGPLFIMALSKIRVNGPSFDVIAMKLTTLHCPSDQHPHEGAQLTKKKFKSAREHQKLLAHPQVSATVSSSSE
ncbi:unnamed protein product [Cylicocyclus nassatus]|uniref:Uncharacterized protein n=1 Tax=Cylicocyclus nassatus TaxID=53992 RepID=A0AA36MGV5_CYLNA|nr:unnamed protein product [Cylicocyclus nassatus]